MTVKELIKFLQTQPPDALCLWGEGYGAKDLDGLVSAGRTHYDHDGEWKEGPVVLFGYSLDVT